MTDSQAPESSRPSGLLGTEPAYPLPLTTGGNGAIYDGSDVGAPVGLTKRELFAAMVMQGFASTVAPDEAPYDVGSVAEYAVKWADALLKELAR